MPALWEPLGREVYAHTLPCRPKADWESLELHLERVGLLAGSFAAAFGATEWGELLGKYHDLGKLSSAFQEYLLRTSDPDAGLEQAPSGRVDHSTFGARSVAERVRKHRGQVLAYCIAGHHSGLPDGTADEEDWQRATLRHRLNATDHPIPAVDDVHLRFAVPSLSLPLRPDPAATGGISGFQIAFFTRMLFSCLVDADRTATVEFCDPEGARSRAQERPPLRALKDELDAHLARKHAAVQATSVNRMRAQVLSQCRTAASLRPGFFSLQVPTGGGKTYSSLAFALDHAARLDLRRVVVAIPFTSIIEQTAAVYREALGPHARSGLIEHHTNIQPVHDTRSNQLGAENWDAPLVVTTNVQLLESLFASATTPCRKLHRLAGSVLILDEAQTIPVELLKPSLAALKELVLNYGCSVVLCTATHPALERRSDFSLGFDHVRPIIHDVAKVFDALRRVEVHPIGRITNDVLADRLAAEPAVLCIVNTRPHAAKLYSDLVSRCNREHCFHLTTWMCGKHRREVLAIIRDRLKRNLPCRVVSTQLLEAGVDLDFPAVYRASAGFDSIAQAAGRCNREGNLAIGHTYVFETETLPPPGLQREAAQIGKELIGRHPDPIAPDAIESYFRLYYWSQQHRWDAHAVMPPLNADLRNSVLAIQFRTAASRFKIIRDEQQPILVAYDETARSFSLALARGVVEYVPQRHLQPYLVSVHPQMLFDLQERGSILEHPSGVWLLVSEGAYSQEKGLIAEAWVNQPRLQPLMEV